MADNGYRHHPEAPQDPQALAAGLASGIYYLPPDVTAIHGLARGSRYMFTRDELIVDSKALSRQPDLADALSEVADRVDPPEDSPPSYRSDEPMTAARRQEDQRALWSADALRAFGFERFRLRIDSDGRRPEVPEVLDDLEDRFGDDVGVFPDYVLAGAQFGEYGPADRPKRVATPLPGPPPQVAEGPGRGVKVAVIDSGIRAEHLWVKGRATGDAEDRDDDVRSVPDYLEGHGTFIAGLILQKAPGATVIVKAAMDPNGLARDREVAGAIHDLPDDVDIINLSLGGFARRPQLLPLIQHALEARFVKKTTLVVVAAAGNGVTNAKGELVGVTERFYPAALPRVHAVGALDADGQRASFSNYGSWVTDWALGVGLTSSYIDDDTATGTDLEGATWDGTSFATALVTGSLAALMSP